MMTFGTEQKGYNGDKPAHELKPGDVLDCSWGYEQTNVEFWRVVSVGKKFFQLRRIAARKIEGSDGFMSDRVICGDEELDETAKGYITKNGYLKLGPKLLTVYDGKPMHRSWYG